ncbi:hypothetical protein OC498_09730 [Acinetobacter bohemicus]|uniref:hypothetical protein n=1 Tax=Acinetobacter TaxID=469 RepID=UPI000949072D|nr:MULTISPECIES: hypothetical protein [Acinetobacter]MCO8042913.1 hypothetical protein [Acinetobacter sp. S4400-12]MCO8044444.1 hypothetical protein [Acinetobacter sp. S4397-1]MCU4451203.1 hypothetical protein [Acinetobacter lwoffii]MCU7225181.1 hypothetical protein [Acinetobacter bohemicus]NHB65981.1 hypothetical protein [Acinetobacter sp. GFQ9D191M]
MLKDKEFIGRVCRMTNTNNPIDFSVLKVIRSTESSILGFEISRKNTNGAQSETALKDDVKFQDHDNWISGSDLIIQLLEQKINTLRRQIKISSAKRK